MVHSVVDPELIYSGFDLAEQRALEDCDVSRIYDVLEKCDSMMALTTAMSRMSIMILEN
jgi:hypothetical protein